MSRIIQVSMLSGGQTTGDTIVALLDDGTLWTDGGSGYWRQIKHPFDTGPQVIPTLEQFELGEDDAQTLLDYRSKPAEPVDLEPEPKREILGRTGRE